MWNADWTIPKNMLRNHIKSAIRTLSKNKAFAGINLFGLSIGMACFILIIAYVSRENSYDKYHKNANRIYRIVENMRTDNQDFYQATTSPPMGPTFAREFPEVENYVRFSNWLFDTYIVRVDEKVFNEPDCYHADSTVFNIFSFKLLKGNPRKVLSEPYSMVLDRQTAIKYFGSKDPIGQTVELNNENYKVTGVMEEVPENSHFRFNMLVSMTSFIKNKEWENNAWGYNAFYTYLLLTDNKTAPANLRMKIPAYIDKYISKFSNQYKTYYSDLPIQSLISIYTETPLTWENGKRGSKTNIVILIGIAVLIILIACLNYVNLATAMVGRRLKEVGLRKTLGALRSQLFVQYLAESAIFSVLALFLAALFAILARPIINSLLGQSISLSYDGGSIGFWSPFFAGALLIGLLSGIYPALSLSGLKPIQLYKSQTHSISGNKWLRRGFVSVQFFISMSLIACSLVVLNQLDFVRSADLGFKKDRTVIVEFPENKSSSGYAVFKNIFQETSGVTSVTGSSSVPGDPIDNAYCLFEKNVGSFSETSINVLTADRDFLSAYGIETIAGKSFETFHSDSGNHFMINKAAASHFGWDPAEQAVGRTVDLQGQERNDHRCDTRFPL